MREWGTNREREEEPRWRRGRREEEPRLRWGRREEEPGRRRERRGKGPKWRREGDKRGQDGRGGWREEESRLGRIREVEMKRSQYGGRRKEEEPRWWRGRS